MYSNLCRPKSLVNSHLVASSRLGGSTQLAVSIEVPKTQSLKTASLTIPTLTHAITVASMAMAGTPLPRLGNWNAQLTENTVTIVDMPITLGLCLKPNHQGSKGLPHPMPPQLKQKVQCLMPCAWSIILVNTKVLVPLPLTHLYNDLNDCWVRKKSQPQPLITLTATLHPNDYKALGFQPSSLNLYNFLPSQIQAARAVLQAPRSFAAWALTRKTSSQSQHPCMLPTTVASRSWVQSS